jgi:hypothetical protein
VTSRSLVRNGILISGGNGNLKAIQSGN